MDLSPEGRERQGPVGGALWEAGVPAVGVVMAKPPDWVFLKGRG